MASNFCDKCGSFLMMNDQEEKDSIRTLLLPLFKLIPTFSGERQDLGLFIKSVNAARILAAPQMKTTMLEIIKAKITGAAGKLLKNKNCTEWEQIKEILISEYGPVEESQEDSDLEELNTVKPDSTQDNPKGKKSYKKDFSGSSKNSENRSSKPLQDKNSTKDKTYENEKQKNKKETEKQIVNCVKVKKEFVEMGIQTEEMKAFRDRETQTIMPRVKIFKEQQTQTEQIFLSVDKSAENIKSEKNSDVISATKDKAEDNKNEKINAEEKIPNPFHENPVKVSAAEDTTAKRRFSVDSPKVKNRSIANLSNSQNSSSDQNSEKSKNDEAPPKSTSHSIANTSSEPKKHSSEENCEKIETKDSSLKTEKREPKAEDNSNPGRSKLGDEHSYSRKKSNNEHSKPGEHSKPIEEHSYNRKKLTDENPFRSQPAKERSKSRTKSTEEKGPKSRTASPNRKDSPKPLMDLKTRQRGKSRSPRSQKPRTRPLMEVDTRPTDRSRSPQSARSKSRNQSRPIDVVHSGHSNRESHSRKSRPLSPSPSYGKRPRTDRRETFCEFCQKRGHETYDCWHFKKLCTYCGENGHRESQCKEKALQSLGTGVNSFSYQEQNPPWTFGQDAFLQCSQNFNNFNYN